MSEGAPTTVQAAVDILMSCLIAKAKEHEITLTQPHMVRKWLYEKTKLAVRAGTSFEDRREDRRRALLGALQLISMTKTSYFRTVMNADPILLEHLRECVRTLDLSHVRIKKMTKRSTVVANEALANTHGDAPPVATGAQEISVGQKRTHEEMDSVPDDLLCPITHELMENPVIAADGHSYERSAINAWLQKENTSPMTRETLANKTLMPNRTLKKVIREHKEKTLHLSGSGGGGGGGSSSSA